MLSKASEILFDLRSNGTDPVWWKRTFRRRIVGQLYYGYLQKNDGVRVMEESWDILIILDGCRYDLFEDLLRREYEYLIGDLESRTSRGASTRQFLEENFTDGRYEDTVYITANPFVTEEVDDAFHKVVSVWKEQWSDSDHTVLPQDLYNVALQQATEYPLKRIIIHFMQPHYPFVGSGLLEQVEGSRTYEDTSVWNMLERGKLDHEEVMVAYRENLWLVLPYALELSDELKGKTVITSDHGNGAGEFCWPFPVQVYGHPRNIRKRPVVKVPWLVIEGETRREIRSESGNDTAEYDDDVVKERLRQLGYKA